MTTARKIAIGAAVGLGALIVLAVAGALIEVDDGDDRVESAEQQQEATATVTVEAPTDAPAPLPPAETPTPRPEPTPTPTPAPIPTADDPDELPAELRVIIWRETLREHGLGYLASESFTDADVIELAGYACDVARQSADADELLGDVIAANAGSGLTSEEAGGIVGAALGAFCPDQVTRLGLDR